MADSNQYWSRRAGLLVVLGAGMALFALTLAYYESSTLTWLLLAASGFITVYSVYLLLRDRRSPSNRSNPS